MNARAAGPVFTPQRRIGVVALTFALVGLTGVPSLFADFRLDLTLLSLPVALGLLTHRESWRKAALAYVVVLTLTFFVSLSLLSGDS